MVSVKEMKIIYTVKRHTNMIFPRLHLDLMKYYKGKDATVEADFDKKIITIEIHDSELAETNLKDINSCFGLGKKMISAFVKTQVFIYGKEVK